MRRQIRTYLLRLAPQPRPAVQRPSGTRRKANRTPARIGLTTVKNVEIAPTFRPQPVSSPPSATDQETGPKKGRSQSDF